MSSAPRHEEHDDLDARARDLFVTWLEADSGTRPDPKSLCGGDTELERRLESLIAAAPGVFDAFAALGPSEAPRDFPERLGEFRIVDRLGEGGMGSVYLAIQESLGRPVALKVLGDYRFRDPDAAERFRREAATAASLDHPNIVPVYAVGEDRGLAFIAMKLLPGSGLDRQLGRLAPRRVAEIGAAIARALDAAHLAGIVHRDVKPANVILDGDVPILVDFGLARTLGDVALTRTGAVAGTLPFMAPEQLRGGRARPEPRTDVYALGATLFQVTTGRLPFPEEDPEQLVRAIASDPPPRMALPAKERDFETLVHRALEKDPARRFPTALDFAEELERFVRGEPILSRRTGALGRLVRLARRHPRAAVVSAVAAAALTTVVTVWTIRERGHRATLARTLDAARAAITAGDLDLAEGLAAEAVRRADDHAEVRALAREVEARRALEALLDQLQDRAAVQGSSLLDELLRRVEATGASSLSPRRARMAIALAHLLRGHAAEARVELDRLAQSPPPDGGPGRDLTALLAAADGQRDLLLPPDGGVDAESHVFAALALRALGAPPEQQLQEIESAIAADDRAVRPKLAKAVFLADCGRHAEARSAFEGLSASGIAGALVRRNRARLCVIAGELGRAEVLLDELAPSERNSGTELLRAEIRRRRGDIDGADRAVEALLETHPDDVSVLSDAATVAALRGRPADARRRFERAREIAGSAPLRDVAAASLLALELAELAGTEDPTAEAALDEGALRKLAELESAAAILATNTADATARGRALAAAAWAARLRGDLPLAVDRLAKAMRSDPGTSGHATNYVASALALATEPGTERSDRARLLEAAAVAAAKVVAAEGTGDLPSTVTEVDEAHFALSVIASEKGDRVTCLRAALEAKARCERTGRRARLPELEALIAWARSP